MSRKSILMIRPWIEDFSAFDHFAQPLGFLVIARRLMQAGFDVHYLDCLRSTLPITGTPDTDKRLLHPFRAVRIGKPDPFSGIPRHYRRFGLSDEAIRDRLNEMERPDAVLVTTGMTYWYGPLIALMDMLTERFGPLPIALGGIHATIAPDHLTRLLPQARIFPGEADEIFFRWVREHAGGEFRADVTEITPAWELAGPIGYAPIMTSRGCMHRCDYCVASAMSHARQVRRVEVISREIDHLIRVHGFRHFALYDDDLGCGTREGLEHFKQFLRMLCERAEHMTWHTPNALGIASVTEEIACLMRTAGFEQPRLSLHHLDRRLGPRGLDDSALQAYSRAAEHLIRAGYEAAALSCYVIAGLPDQRLEWLDRACMQLLSIGIRPYLAQFSPIPGTPLGDVRLGQLGYRSDADMLLTNKILSVYRHGGWSGAEYQAFASDLKHRRQNPCSVPAEFEQRDVSDETREIG